MLLVIEALLLILAALGQDHRAAAAAVKGQIITLNMEEKSVDDQYCECTKKMADLVETKLLKEELKDSSVFKRAWDKEKEFVKAPRDDLTKNNLIAIYVYSAANVYKNFNADTRRDKKKYIDNEYKWYSLHFLLTNAIQILKKTQNQCHLTYRGTNVEFNKDVLNKEVRFGSFASSSLDLKVTKKFGNTSCFEIHTCEGANVAKYSKLPHEKEVLIPPYEKFKVTAVKTKDELKDLWCETVFELKSTGTRSDLNCALVEKRFKKPSKNPSQILKNISKTKTKYYVLNKVF